MKDTKEKEKVEQSEFCECSKPHISKFPDGKHYCMDCWKEWYH